MTVTVSIDELGPVDWIVVEFPGTKLTGEIAPIIKDYVDRGLIKVLDLVFLKKDEDGSLEAFEASDLGVSEIRELRGYERDLAMVLSEQDVADLAETTAETTAATASSTNLERRIPGWRCGTSRLGYRPNPGPGR